MLSTYAKKISCVTMENKKNNFELYYFNILNDRHEAYILW